MRLVKSMFFAIAFFGAIFFLSGVSLAQEAPVAGKDSPAWKAKHKVRVKLLKDAAVALKQSHPDLAKGLQELSERKPNTEMQKMTEEKNEK